MTTPRIQLDAKWVLTENKVGTPIIEPTKQQRGSYFAATWTVFIYGRFNDFPIGAREKARRILGLPTKYDPQATPRALSEH